MTLAQQKVGQGEENEDAEGSMLYYIHPASSFGLIVVLNGWSPIWK
jgi:hypothetical protein